MEGEEVKKLTSSLFIKGREGVNISKVKCYYCGGIIDKDLEEVVKINQRRYAHKKCAEDYMVETEQSEKDKIELEKYICNLFKEPEINYKIERQIERFRNENHYTYSGMLKALIFHYEINNGDVNKSNGGIGILPYVYQLAFDYYYNVWERQQLNQDLSSNIQEHLPKPIKIIIKPPLRKTGKKPFFKEEQNE